MKPSDPGEAMENLGTPQRSCFRELSSASAAAGIPNVSDERLTTIRAISGSCDRASRWAASSADGSRGRRYCSARAVPAPTRMTSACARSERNIMRSVGLLMAPLVPSITAAPSKVDTMFVKIHGRSAVGSRISDPAISGISDKSVRLMTLNVWFVFTATPIETGPRSSRSSRVRLSPDYSQAVDTRKLLRCAGMALGIPSSRSIHLLCVVGQVPLVILASVIADCCGELGRYSQSRPLLSHRPSSLECRNGLGCTRPDGGSSATVGRRNIGLGDPARLGRHRFGVVVGAYLCLVACAPVHSKSKTLLALYLRVSSEVDVCICLQPFPILCTGACKCP